ncbi:hypothetical protein D9613_010503 [Agrocybe pediades]|uniref:Transcription activator GCR1-like domain-containing protein n=1 Tax=Agrocybe pediades TaxID=84607 RepID=A0A8H4QF64_9AGAR|nr:hypothetical protein D9613_010503 [Agrocybe pediades]
MPDSHYQPVLVPNTMTNMNAATSASAFHPATAEPSPTNFPEHNGFVDINFPGPFSLLDSSATSMDDTSNQPSPPSAKRRRIEDATTVPATSGIDTIREEAHRLRLQVEKQLVSGKGTEQCYPRHVQRYEKFWEKDQAERAESDPKHVHEPAHPILGEKVALFLNHELERNKLDKNGREIPGTSVGKEHIKQTISALQSYIRSHQHLPVYANCPETKVLLRHQDLVKSFEEVACANEPTRIKEAHTMKTKGTSADGYTTAEVLRMANWLLQGHGLSKNQLCLAIRDRAMLLLASNVAFRGDSTRRTLWSDLFSQRVPMPLIGDTMELQAVVILADQAKTNTNGRIDEHGMFRHRDPELCGFGGLAFHFFSHFHIQKKPPPDFSPDFEDPKHSEFGRRDWYGIHAFPGGKISAKSSNKGMMTAMSYENHRERFINMHTSCNVDITAVTHGCRFYAADKARKYGATGLEVKALGNWRTGDAYSEIYNRSLPTRAMLASALFNADEPRSYVLPRGHLIPPASLLSRLFPWIESETEAYEARLEKYGAKAVDHALRHFLALLKEMRVILLQDAAVLFQKYPDIAMWKYAPFNSVEFRDFSKQSCVILERAAVEAVENFKRLPDQVAATLRASIETIQIQRRLEHEDLSSQLMYMREMLRSNTNSRKRSRSTKSSGSGSITPSESPSPEPDTMRVDPQSPTRSELLKAHEANARRSFKAALPDQLPLPLDAASIINPPVLELKAAAEVDEVARLPASQYISPEHSAESKWPPDLKMFQASFILSNCTKEREVQLSSLRELIKVFGSEKLVRHQFEWSCSPKPAIPSVGSEKLVRHQFEWSCSPKPAIPSEWLPFYTFNTAIKTIEDVWKEWSEGLDGCISVQQLNNRWAARWRRQNEGQKTEAARRKVITTLVTDLAKKPNWTADLALRFLNERYPIPSGVNGPKHLSSIRSFITHLQNTKTGKLNREEIMTAASLYCR